MGAKAPLKFGRSVSPIETKVSYDIFKRFPSEHNAPKAKHLRSVLRHALKLDYVDILQL